MIEYDLLHFFFLCPAFDFNIEIENWEEEKLKIRLIFFRGGGIAADVGYIPTFETVGMCVGKVFQKKKKKKKKK